MMFGGAFFLKPLIMRFVLKRHWNTGTLQRKPAVVLRKSSIKKVLLIFFKLPMMSSPNLDVNEHKNHAHTYNTHPSELSADGPTRVAKMNKLGNKLPGKPKWKVLKSAKPIWVACEDAYLFLFCKYILRRSFFLLHRAWLTRSAQGDSILAAANQS